MVIWAMGRLSQPSAPTFEICHAILQLTEQVKLYMLMLDLELPELVEDLFTTLLGCPRCMGYMSMLA